MKWMKIVALAVAIISAIVFTSFSRGSATVESQSGCPASSSAFQVDYFGFPLKDYWICEIPQYHGSIFYKAGSIFKVVVDAAVGLGVVLLPALYLTRRMSK